MNTVDISRHPCFNEETRHKTGRVHLPVAPKCNVKCNFCNRKFDCVNESRPGVTTRILSPGQALSYLHEVTETRSDLAVVGIAGPGDPFANPEETLETLRRVRVDFPDMLLCVATNGLNLPDYVEELAELQVSHVTITVSAVDPEIGGQIYGWVRDGKKVYRGREAGELMLERQLKGIKLLKKHNIIVKINSIVIPGINDRHIFSIARFMQEKGVDIMNCMGLKPVDGTPFENIEEPSRKLIKRIQLCAGEYIPQMSHCAKCRADAAGKIGEALTKETQCCLEKAAARPLEPKDERPYIAVASREGMLVNQHLGDAESLWIFGPGSSSIFPLIETRPTPESGQGDERWEKLAEALQDCRALLTSGVGGKPTRILKEHGIEVTMMNGMIHEGLDAVYNGKPIRMPVREHKCGTGCAGDGTGCG